MPLVEELAKFELISDKKIACGAKNVRIMKKYLEKRAEGAKNWHFCDNFRIFSELEKCQNNMVFEITGYETPPTIHSIYNISVLKYPVTSWKIYG